MTNIVVHIDPAVTTIPWVKTSFFPKGQKLSLNGKTYQVVTDNYFSSGSIDNDLADQKIILLASGEEVGKLVGTTKNLQTQLNNIAVQGRFEAENKDTEIKIGMPVATHSSGTGIVKADATNTSKPCIALSQKEVKNKFSGSYVTDGIWTMDDWTAVTGTALLQPKAIYFLDTTAGRLTTASPVNSGNISQEIGRAVSTKELEITIKSPILL